MLHLENVCIFDDSYSEKCPDDYLVYSGFSFGLCCFVIQRPEALSSHMTSGQCLCPCCPLVAGCAHLGPAVQL